MKLISFIVGRDSFGTRAKCARRNNGRTFLGRNRGRLWNLAKGRQCPHGPGAFSPSSPIPPQKNPHVGCQILTRSIFKRL